MKKGIEVGTSVTSKKYGNGTISRIITPSTGYIEVDFNGSLRKLMLKYSDVEIEGISITKSASVGMSASEKRHAADAKAKAAYAALSPLKKIQQEILSVNGLIKGDRTSLSYEIFSEHLSAIASAAEKVGNQFIIDVCKSIDKYMGASEKQSYCVARFAAENNIEF